MWGNEESESHLKLMHTCYWCAWSDVSLKGAPINQFSIEEIHVCECKIQNYCSARSIFI